VTPKLVLGRLRRMEWSMVSKAALRSKDTRRVDLPVSEGWKMLLVVDKRAVSVEKLRRCAD